MGMIDEILSWQNISMAIAAVKQNRGAAGVDEMTVDELEGYMKENYTRIVQQIKTGRYTPQPVRRVYIPKANGKQRPLGIPTVVDRASCGLGSFCPMRDPLVGVLCSTAPLAQASSHIFILV